MKTQRLVAKKSSTAKENARPATYLRSIRPGNNVHAPSEIGVDSFQADRPPTHMYRTSPLKGLWGHTNGGFYHDGRFATLNDVIQHYNSFLGLGLTDQQVHDLVEYLKSL